MNSDTSIDDVIAWCAASIGGADSWVQLFPAGRFVGRDGRGPWHISDAAAVIAASLTGGLDRGLLVDRDHQTDEAPRGTPIAAAGWIKELEAREDGIWARVDWTAAARAQIDAGEYAYMSPVFLHGNDGRIKRILRASLTNNPALPLRAVASQLKQKEHQMDELRKSLAKSLGLEQDAVDDAIQKAVAAAVKDRADIHGLLTRLEDALGLEEAKPDELVDRVKALASADPDPSKFAPVGEVERLSKELASMRSRIAGDEAVRAVDAAISEGKLIPAQRDWALAYATKDPESFGTFVKSQPVVLAPGRHPIGNNPPTAKGELDEADLALCSQLGIEPDEYKKTLASEAR